MAGDEGSSAAQVLVPETIAYLCKKQETRAELRKWGGRGYRSTSVNPFYRVNG
jgi:hypothetical protein